MFSLDSNSFINSFLVIRDFFNALVSVLGFNFKSVVYFSIAVASIPLLIGFPISQFAKSSVKFSRSRIKNSKKG